MRVPLWRGGQALGHLCPAYSSRTCWAGHDSLVICIYICMGGRRSVITSWLCLRDKPTGPCQGRMLFSWLLLSVILSLLKGSAIREAIWQYMAVY